MLLFLYLKDVMTYKYAKNLIRFLFYHNDNSLSYILIFGFLSIKYSEKYKEWFFHIWNSMYDINQLEKDKYVLNETQLALISVLKKQRKKLQFFE